MYSPTTRLLTILELLQSKASVTGPELAAKLEVEVRSIRRYITMLRDMGIPVESEPGRYGSYYLRPGFRLPPLMFNNGEILAIILGLMAVRHLGLSGAVAVESAAAKIERVLPEELRDRVRAVQAVLTLNIPSYDNASEEMIAQFSIAAYQHSQLWIEYQGSRDSKTEREIDVYGLVYHGGNWYVTAYCHLREDVRIFRLDRVQQVRMLDRMFKPPRDFDPVSHLLQSMASLPSTWTIEVLLNLSLEQARLRIPRDMAVLEASGDGTLMRLWADRLEWAAHYLISLRCPFTVYHPPELRVELRRVAESIIEMAQEPVVQP